MWSIGRKESYIAGWCQTQSAYPHEGVDVSQFPGGWAPRGDGTYVGCDVTTDFPGAGTSSYQSHSHVKSQLALVPGRQHSGDIWRGNELGFFVVNEQFWPASLTPRSVVLGTSVQHHMLVRPVLERIYGHCDEACLLALRDSARVFVRTRQSLQVSVDLKVWVHQELFKRMFPGAENPLDPIEFIAVQTQFLSLAVATQALPPLVTDLVARATLAKLDDYFHVYKRLVQRFYRVDASDVLVSAVLNVMLSAGGLSVPIMISAGLWVLHNEHQGQFATVDLRNNSLAFVY